MDAMADEALAYMLPRLDEGNSLVNFLLELKDLKHMNPTASVKRIVKGRPALKALGTSTKAKKKFFKELNNRLNGAHLNASFGITPFLRDVRSIYDELVTLSAKLAVLKQNESKVITRHYKRVIPDSPGVLPNYEWTARTFWGPLSWCTQFKHDVNNGAGTRDNLYPAYEARWIGLPTYHATQKYIYTLDHMSGLDEAIATHLDALGVRIDPGIVWDALPFSFLVDWVVDVSSFLHSFARNNYPIQVSRGDFCHSLAYSSECVVYMYMSDCAGGPSLPAVWGPGDPVFGPPGGTAIFPIYIGQRSYYRRERAEPSTTASIQARAPNLRQAALAGSLLLTRKKGWNSVQYHHEHGGTH
jgi:hypothetical protein